MSALTDCAVLPDHIEQTCNDYRKGGISAFAVLKSDHTITDFTSASQWQTNIDNGKVKIVKKIKGTLPEASPVEGENPVPCGAENILDLFDHTFQWKDFNVNAFNDSFYQKLNQASGRSLAFFYCEENEIRVVSDTVTFIVPPASSPEGNREKQFFNGKASWSSSPDEFPVLHTAPAGIFT